MQGELLRALYRHCECSFRTGIVGKVWNDAKDNNGDVWDVKRKNSVKYPKLKLPKWKSGQARRNVWDMGHISEKHSWKKLRQRYIKDRKITKKKLNDIYNYPTKYQPEDSLRNQKKVDDF